MDEYWTGDYRQLLYDGNNYLFALNDGADIKTYFINPVTGHLDRITQPIWCGDGLGPQTRIAKLNNWFYITAYESKTKIYDISNIDSPLWTTSIWPNPNDFSNALGICLNNGYCYLGAQGQLLVFPVGKESPIERLDLRGGFRDVKKKHNYLYTATGSEGLLIFDVTDRTHPFQIAKLHFTNGLHKVYVDSSNYLYGLSDDRVWIINIANPYSPVPVSSFVVPWKYPGSNENCRIKNLVVKNNFAYVFYNDRQDNWLS